MMKKTIFGAVLLLVLSLAASWATAQEDMRFVDNAAFEVPRRPPAVFDHDLHNDTAAIDDCAQCHHVYDENGQKSEYDSSEGESCICLKTAGLCPDCVRPIIGTARAVTWPGVRARSPAHSAM